MSSPAIPPEPSPVVTEGDHPSVPRQRLAPEAVLDFGGKMRAFREGRAQFPHEDLAKHAGEWVAFSADGRRLLAAAVDLLDLEHALTRAGIDAREVVFEQVVAGDSQLGGRNCFEPALPVSGGTPGRTRAALAFADGDGPLSTSCSPPHPGPRNDPLPRLRSSPGRYRSGRHDFSPVRRSGPGRFPGARRAGRQYDSLAGQPLPDSLRRRGRPWSPLRRPPFAILCSGRPGACSTST